MDHHYGLGLVPLTTDLMYLYVSPTPLTIPPTSLTPLPLDLIGKVVYTYV